MMTAFALIETPSSVTMPWHFHFQSASFRFGLQDESPSQFLSVRSCIRSTNLYRIASANAYGRAFAGVQSFKLYAGRIRRLRHRAARMSISLTSVLAETADRRIATHVTDAIEIGRHQSACVAQGERRRVQLRCGVSRSTTMM